MANYYIDFEFIEGFHKPIFGKRRHFIDLISVGIVCSDGREYSAISKEFNPNDASQWVKDNVIAKLTYQEPWEQVYQGWEAVKKIGKSNKQIAQEIIDFINPHLLPSGRINSSVFLAADFSEKHNIKTFPPTEEIPFVQHFAQPMFYGYFADYDWVLFCSLWGKMIDLPKGFPFYCRDLKQMVDDWVEKAIPDFEKHHNEILTFDQALERLKASDSYPKQTNEHDALVDARWNRDLHRFLLS